MRNESSIAALKGGVREAGRQIGLGERAAYAAAAAGRIPAIRMGRFWVIPLPAWQRFLNGEWRPEEVG